MQLSAILVQKVLWKKSPQKQRLDTFLSAFLPATRIHSCLVQYLIPDVSFHPSATATFHVPTDCHPEVSWNPLWIGIQWPSPALNHSHLHSRTGPFAAALHGDSGRGRTAFSHLNSRVQTGKHLLGVWFSSKAEWDVGQLQQHCLSLGQLLLHPLGPASLLGMCDGEGTREGEATHSCHTV